VSIHPNQILRPGTDCCSITGGFQKNPRPKSPHPRSRGMARPRLLALLRHMVPWHHSEPPQTSPPPLPQSQLTNQLTHWLSRTPIFGPKDKIVEGLTEAWCIAKIHRLIGPLDPPVKNPTCEEEFWMAKNLLSTAYEHPDTKLETQLITVVSLRQELERLPGPKV
jgi:hypothetical protein